MVPNSNLFVIFHKKKCEPISQQQPSVKRFARTLKVLFFVWQIKTNMKTSETINLDNSFYHSHLNILLSVKHVI